MALERLGELLDRRGSFEELELELCRRIREGEIGLDSPGLVEHLRATTLAKLAVDQPRYASYRRAKSAEKRICGILVSKAVFFGARSAPRKLFGVF